METTSSVKVARQLVSDLEGLAVSSSSSSLLPSLQQFYRLGLLLFRIQTQTRTSNSSNNDPVLAAYRILIESIPDQALRPIFVDLRRASRRLLGSGNGMNEVDIEDLGLAARSMAGLVGAFSDDRRGIGIGIANDAAAATATASRSRSRLCRVVYEHEWISTLAAFYDRFVVAEKRQPGSNVASATNSSSAVMETNKTAVLSCLSRLLLDGVVLLKNSPVEELLLEAIRAMEEESTDCLRDLQEWQLAKEPFRRTLEDSIRNIGTNNSNNNKHEDEATMLERAQQREYIASMLESAREQLSSMEVPAAAVQQRASVPPAAPTPPVPSSSTADTELDRRINQVLQILPHFGEGFVEVALGFHKGDVEATVATLLNHPSDGNSNSNSNSNNNYPTALRVLDPKLPRRKREFRTYQTKEEEATSARQARNDVKERIALEEKQKRDEYEALVVVSASAPAPVAAQQQQHQDQDDNNASEHATTNAKGNTNTNKKKLTRKELRREKLRQKAASEYDDDYDDQYDEVDIKLGAADDGFTTDNVNANGNTNTSAMTYEQVKLYNKIVQEDESDVSFWESNRNTNKGGGNSKNNNTGNGNVETTKKWGPDKIKGGRTIGEDGKVVRKPGGVKKKKSNNNNNNNNNANNKQSGNNAKNKKGQGENSKNNKNAGANNNSNSAGAGANNANTKKKPKTKPKSDNRVNRQRDRKMTKQGAFGV